MRVLNQSIAVTVKIRLNHDYSFWLGQGQWFWNCVLSYVGAEVVFLFIMKSELFITRNFCGLLNFEVEDIVHSKYGTKWVDSTLVQRCLKLHFLLQSSSDWKTVTKQSRQFVIHTSKTGTYPRPSLGFSSHVHLFRTQVVHLVMEICLL